MRYNHEDDPVLARIRTLIVETVAPEKIILFGSRARGEISEDSDYDILVVKDQIENEREITRKINYRLLRENIQQAVDVIAASKEKWDRYQRVPGYVYKKIDAEGIPIYG
jgi:uncharacterized protein